MNREQERNNYLAFLFARFRLYINYPEAQYALTRNSRKRIFSIDQLQTLIHKV
jgi:hypothetical protein